MRILVIPDVQVKPGQNFRFLSWVGKYAVDKKPDVIVQIGDFADMSSLSSYDVGKKSFEGRRYTDDIAACSSAMAYLMAPILKEQVRLETNKKKRWNPRLVLTYGNHENRIHKAIDNDRKLEGLISFADLGYEEYGWEVIPFLQPITIGGISFCHYFTSGVMGRPISSARALVTKKHMSCVMGHVQSSEIDMSQRKADGTPLLGLFAGIYTPYDEEYLDYQSNKQHRQIWMLQEVEDGFCYPQPISLEFLKNKYENKQ